MTSVSPDIPDSLPAASSISESRHSDHSIRKLALVGALVLVLVIALVATASIFLLRNPATTEILRDIVIIWIALEALVIGVALIALVVQLARLTSLLQHEIKPILENTGDTIKTLRGTAQFVSDNVADPVVKLSATVAGIQRFLGLLAPGWRRGRKQK